MNGTTAVNTANSWVIIDRVKVLTHGGTALNVGTITATAAVNATITAAMLPTAGTTQMAIFGVPINHKFYMTSIYVNMLKAGGGAVSADLSILWNPYVATDTTKYIIRHTMGLVKDGVSSMSHEFCPPKVFIGPGIIKINGIASADDLDISAGFDGILIAD